MEWKMNERSAYSTLSTQEKRAKQLMVMSIVLLLRCQCHNPFHLSVDEMMSTFFNGFSCVSFFFFYISPSVYVSLATMPYCHSLSAISYQIPHCEQVYSHLPQLYVRTSNNNRNVWLGRGNGSSGERNTWRCFIGHAAKLCSLCVCNVFIVNHPKCYMTLSPSVFIKRDALVLLLAPFIRYSMFLLLLLFAPCSGAKFFSNGWLWTKRENGALWSQITWKDRKSNKTYSWEN